MERLFSEKPAKKPIGMLKDRPQCERCGRPVKVSSDELLLDEILCPSCEAGLKSGKLDKFYTEEDRE